MHAIWICVYSRPDEGLLCTENIQQCKKLATHEEDSSSIKVARWINMQKDPQKTGGYKDTLRAITAILQCIRIALDVIVLLSISS